MPKKMPGPFVPLDLRLPDRGQTRKAGPDAELLLYRSFIWCKTHPWSNGFIPDDDLPAVGKRIPNLEQAAAALVEVGYWVADDEDGVPGFSVPSWSKWNPSLDEMHETRTQKVKGAAIANHKLGRHEGKIDKACPLCTAD